MKLSYSSYIHVNMNIFLIDLVMILQLGSLPVCQPPPSGGAMQELHHWQRGPEHLLLAGLPPPLPGGDQVLQVRLGPQLYLMFGDTPELCLAELPRVIVAEYGYFVRLDFRDSFRIEPPSNEGKCDYDYLEVSNYSQTCPP